MLKFPVIGNVYVIICYLSSANCYLAKHLINNFLTNKDKLHVYMRHNYCSVSHVVKGMCTHIRTYAIGIIK